MGKVYGLADHEGGRQELAGNDNQKGDLALLTALAAGSSIKDAAKVAGISERTAHRRLEDLEFQERIAELRTQLLSKAVGRLTDATTEAADTMRSLLQSKSDSVRLSAARAILELAPKLREAVELERRIAQLETEAKKNEDESKT
jgi:molybdenum-dependent DNA-binding transcriptional regulator ModE